MFNHTKMECMYFPVKGRALINVPKIVLNVHLLLQSEKPTAAAVWQTSAGTRQKTRSQPEELICGQCGYSIDHLVQMLALQKGSNVTNEENMAILEKFVK